MALTSGKRLGPYEIVQPLGAGGMGEVYRARDTRLSRDVAIKVLPAHLSSNAEAKQRLEREAHAISALNHPNICTLYDVGHQNGTDYLVMEYLEGVTLADRLSGGPLPVAQVLKYGVEICEGLERAHRTGVVHRDLKPGNIMLTKTGAKLMDFGLAKALAVSASASNLTLSLTSPLSGHAVTSAGTMVGTFQYMAPEQLEGKDASVRSDIFAVGALLYEMVTGKRAFQGNTHASVIASILSSEPPPVSTVEPTSPPALERVIGKCLAKDPDERWQNAGDLASELKWISQPQSSSSFLPRTTARELDSRPVQIAAVAFLVLAIAGWALWFFGAGRKADTNGAVRFSVLPPELHPFVAQGEQSLAISPDGRKLVFAALDNNGRAYLWVRPFDSLTAYKLSGTEGGSFPFWSPDNKFVGFFAQGKLQKASLAGGPTEPICDVGQGVMGGTWNAEGVILIGSPGTNGDTGRPITRCSDSGSENTPVTKLDPARKEISHRWPLFLPDGRHFLYMSFSTDPQKRIIYVGSLDTDEKLRLLSTPFKVGYGAGNLFFIRESSLLAQPLQLSPPKLLADPLVAAEHVSATAVPGVAGFSIAGNGTFAYLDASEPATTQLAWVSRNGNKLSEIGPLTSDVSLTLARDQAIAYVGRVVAGTENPIAGEAPTNVWKIDLAHGSATRLTFGEDRHHRDENPVVSPEGSRAVFASHRGGDAQLYQKPTDGGSEEQLLVNSANLHPIDWSPDGKHLLLHAFGVGGRVYLATMPMSGERKPTPYLDSGQTNQAQGQFSPDGHWIAYTSDESGREEIYISPFPAAEGKWQVSIQGGSQPRWRGDGKELYYISAEGILMAVPIKLVRKLEVGRPNPLFRLETIPPNVHFYGGMANYAPSRDGQRFLVNLVLKATKVSPLDVVLNWAAEPKKQ